MNKPWTMESVAQIWAAGGFDAVAQRHNREIQEIKESAHSVITNLEKIRSEQGETIKRLQDQVSLAEASNRGLKKLVLGEHQ